MIIITGCGRSGTYYMALALQQLGIDVGHEEWGKDGQVGFHAAAVLRGAKKGKPWREHADPENDVVLHQVREPLATISSFQTAQDYSWDFVCAHAPIVRGAPIVQRCMQYWYHWNVLAGKRAVLRYQIEKIDEAWPKICSLIGLPMHTPRPTETKKGWHKRGHTNLSWTDLEAADIDLALQIRHLAHDYGY